MPNVVLIAKTIYVWLDQLPKKYGRDITRLDQIPDEELDLLARWGFTALWLIGIWERSPASQKIKQIMGNPEAVSSAYSLYDYAVARDLGGEDGLDEPGGALPGSGASVWRATWSPTTPASTPAGSGAPRLVHPARLSSLPGLPLHRRRPLLVPTTRHLHRGRLLEPQRCGRGLQARGPPHRQGALHLPRQRRHPHALERHGPAQLPAAARCARR